MRFSQLGLIAHQVLFAALLSLGCGSGGGAQSGAGGHDGEGGQGGEKNDAAPSKSALPEPPTTGPYRACPDTALQSPATGCLCGPLGYGATVCQPECKVDSDCPPTPAGAAPARCRASLGGLYSYCVLPCDVDGGVSCPAGYTCSGFRNIMGPYCAVPGGSLTDVSSRYDNASPEATKPATPVAPATKLCGSTTLSGELSDTDLHLTRSVRLDARCVTSPYQYYQDVHAIELVGPGPHRLELEACEPTNISMALMIFQKVGSTSPYDTVNTCLNLISSPQPAAHPNCTSNGVSARFVGMQPGAVFVVVSSEAPDKTGSYSLSLRSETSTCK